MIDTSICLSYLVVGLHQHDLVAKVLAASLHHELDTGELLSVA